MPAVTVRLTAGQTTSQTVDLRGELITAIQLPTPFDIVTGVVFFRSLLVPGGAELRTSQLNGVNGRSARSLTGYAAGDHIVIPQTYDWAGFGDSYLQVRASDVQAADCDFVLFTRYIV
jgi:hypothetical protein